MFIKLIKPISNALVPSHMVLRQNKIHIKFMQDISLITAKQKILYVNEKGFITPVLPEKNICISSNYGRNVVKEYVLKPNVTFISGIYQPGINFYNPTNKVFDDIKKYSIYLMKQNINTNLFLSMNQSEFALLCLNQSLIQVIGQNNILMQIHNILMSDDLSRDKRKDEINENNSYNERNFNFNRNSEVNIFSISSF